jgi:hypothetical protein
MGFVFTVDLERDVLAAEGLSDNSSADISSPGCIGASRVPVISHPLR